MEPLRKIDPTPRLLEPPTCDDSRLWDLWLSRLHLPALVVADELGLFAFIAENPATADEVAHSFSLSKRGAESLLGVLAGLDFLRKVSGRFHLTNLSREYLLPNSPYYWGGVLAAFRTAPSRYSPQNMLQSLREDPKAKERRVSHAWKTGSISSDQAQQITAYMHAHSFASAFGLARWAQLDTASRLLDVGAGSGCFSIALALRHEHLSCTLLDLPQVCEVAASFIREYGLSHRITTFPANFFEDEWPADHDAILFSNVLHDWDINQCRFLLNRAFNSLDHGGHLLIHEMLQDDDGINLRASAFSLQMAIGTDGSQFTANQISELLSSAGFGEVRFLQTFAHFWTAFARKP